MTETLNNMLDRLASDLQKSTRGQVHGVWELLIAKTDDAVQKIVFSTPMSRDLLPENVQYGVAVRLVAEYPRVDSCLNRFAGLAGKSLRAHPIDVPLAWLVEPSRVHVGTVFPMFKEKELAPQLDALTQLYNNVLRPLANRMDSVSIFDDDSFVPPRFPVETWTLRRVAKALAYDSVAEGLERAQSAIEFLRMYFPASSETDRPSHPLDEQVRNFAAHATMRHTTEVIAVLSYITVNAAVLESGK